MEKDTVTVDVINNLRVNKLLELLESSKTPDDLQTAQDLVVVGLMMFFYFGVERDQLEQLLPDTIDVVEKKMESFTNE